MARMLVWSLAIALHVTILAASSIVHQERVVAVGSADLIITLEPPAPDVVRFTEIPRFP